MTLYNTTQYNTIQYNTIHHDTIQYKYSTIRVTDLEVLYVLQQQSLELRLSLRELFSAGLRLL